MPKVRITVVKLAVHEDLIEKHIKHDRYPEGFVECPRWKVGDTFILENWPGKPKGFTCDWAWADIQRDVAMVMFGANPPWMERSGSAITCCTDGLRPVSFLVERIEE